MDDYQTLERRYGSKSTITAFFDERLHAERAVERLRSEGIPDEGIRLTEGNDPTANPEVRGTEGRGFFEMLGDFFFPNDDRSVYAEGLSRGGYLVTVTNLAPDLFDTALNILDDDGAVDLEERSATWRAEGWTGNYTDLHDPEGLLRTQRDQAEVYQRISADSDPNVVEEPTSYEDEMSPIVSNAINQEAERRVEQSPAAAGMAGAVSGVVLGSPERTRAPFEGRQKVTEGETEEVSEARRYARRDTTQGRRRVWSYILDGEDVADDRDIERDDNRSVDPLSERDINRQ